MQIPTVQQKQMKNVFIKWKKKVRGLFRTID